MGLGERQRWLPKALSLALFICLSRCGTLFAQDVSTASSGQPYSIGLNFGRLGNNIPSTAQSVSFMQSMKVGTVKIYDADSGVLNALANSGLDVVISVTGDLIPNLAANPVAADQWIQNNVVAYPNTLIKIIQVGNELFSYASLNTTWYALVPALKNLQSSLVNRNLANTVKLSTCVAMDVLDISYPPSAGAFRSDIAVPIMQPLLQFLDSTGSTFHMNAYPYFAWASNPVDISLNYALFEAGSVVIDGNLQYTNLLDAQTDAVIAAMEKLGYGDVEVAISETGWPTAGDADQVGANIPNAAYYNRRLVRRALAYPSVGTPRRPNSFIPVYLFALYNENEKPGPETERHWGLLYANGSAVYPIDLTGKLGDSDYPAFTTTTAGSGTTTSATYCVARFDAVDDAKQAALNWACGPGGVDCGPIQSGQSCFVPDTLQEHSSYAFNSYYQQQKKNGGSCDFGGTAVLTTVDPSSETCIYAYTP